MAAPETGQFVLVRKRPALVRNQVAFQDGSSGKELHELDIEYIDGFEYPSEDRIIWEREIGAKVFASQDFPDIGHPQIQPDRPTLYESFLNAFKWSSNCTFSIDGNQIIKTPIPFLSPWYSAVKTEDYQLYPVLKAMEMPRVNLLLADDVGLGKTIEAGLILQELVRQRRLRRILIICPSSLQIQWQDEMKEKFNIDFTIVDSEKVYEVQRELGVDANPWMVYYLEKVMQRAAAAKCSEMVGGAEQVLEMTIQYAKDRIAFGKAIGTYQAIQHHCANMLNDFDASRYMTRRAAWMVSEGLPCAMEVSLAKAWVGPACHRITCLGHEIHGAIAFQHDHDMHLYFKQAVVGEAAFGSSGHHGEVVAKELGL